jgi:hypothetical protein
MSTSISERTDPPAETLGFDVEDLLVSATRYMLGRKTYAVAPHCDALAEAWPQLSSWARETIRRDVERAFERDDWARAEGKEHLPLGMDCDRASWEQVRRAWQQQG